MRKTLLFLLSAFLALPLCAQVQVQATGGGAIQIGGSGSGTAFQVAYIPQGSGQFVLSSPTGCAVGSGGGITGQCGPNNASGGLSGVGCNVCGNTVTFSGVDLSKVPAGATITGLTATVISSGTGGPSSFLAGGSITNAGGGAVSACGSSHCLIPAFAVGTGIGLAWTQTQVSIPFNALPTNYANVQITMSGTGGGGPPGAIQIIAVIYQINYTGTAPPVDTALQIGNGLCFNDSVTPNTLGICPLFPNYFEPNIIAQLPTPSGLNATLFYPVTDGANSTDCSTGGGTDLVWCESTGAAYIGIPFGGSSSSVAFNNITTGTNSSATMQCGSGCTLKPTASSPGVIQANDIAGLVTGPPVSGSGTAGSPFTVTSPVLVASGAAAMGTSTISAGACASAVTVTATGTLTTDRIVYGPNGDPTGVTGYAPSVNGSLYIWAYPSSGNVNFKVCNNTSSAITPGALTLNWEVIR